GDRELHARLEKRGQGIAALRVQERVADGLVGIVQRLQGLGRVDDAAADGQSLQPEALAVPEEAGRRRAVDVEHEPGSGHGRYLPRSLRRSKAIFTAPRRPASAACSMASCHRSSGYRAETSRSRAASWTSSKEVEKSSLVYV